MSDGGRIDPFVTEGVDEIDDDPELDETVDLLNLAPDVEASLREEFGDDAVDTAQATLRARRHTPG
jgi:hypothetical protein